MESIAGCLLGTAMGDAIGLPAEGLSRQRQQRLFGPIEGYRFLFGRGMVSDDTEHTILAAQALMVSAGDPVLFESNLARGLLRWFLLLPAGIGLATLRACIKLALGVPSARSGVRSAGNGPAMRAALIGVCYGDRPEFLKELVRSSSHITHTDPRAELGALAVAWAASLSARTEQGLESFVESFQSLLGPRATEPEAAELLSLARRAMDSAERDESPVAFAASLGLPCGVSGYVNHTVPVALQSARRFASDARAAILSAVTCGGDTDSVAAIVGGIVGARAGDAELPADWKTGLIEWPFSLAWMQGLAAQLHTSVLEEMPQRPRPPFLPALMLRNLLFLCVVLYHGLRRALPPY